MLRTRVNRTTGLPIRTSKEIHNMRKALGVSFKEIKYKKLCSQLSAIK